MTTFKRPDPSPRFEHELRGFLDHEAQLDRADYLPDVLVRSVVTRQRPAWTFPSRWIPMATIAQERVAAGVPWRPLLAVGLLILAVVVAALAFAASRPRLPAPYGPARNGVIVSAWNGDIYASDPDSLATRILIGGPENDSAPVWSLDGTRLAFARRIDRRPAVFVAAADGSRVRLVSSEPMSSVDLHEFAWSPDGSSIVFESDQGGTHAVVVAAADGSGSRILTPKGVNTDSAAWRPGSSTISYRAMDPTTGSYGLRLINSDGSGDRPITPADGRADAYQYAAWSPDGAWLAFTHAAGDSLPPVLHVLNVDDGGDATLPSQGSVMWPDWSPDGGRISYYASHDGGWGVAVATFDPRTRTLTPGEPHGPGMSGFQTLWSPDGEAILVRNVNAVGSLGGNTVLLIDASNGSVRTAPWQDDSYPTWQRLAP